MGRLQAGPSESAAHSSYTAVKGHQEVCASHEREGSPRASREGPRNSWRKSLEPKQGWGGDKGSRGEKGTVFPSRLGVIGQWQVVRCSPLTLRLVGDLPRIRHRSQDGRRDLKAAAEDRAPLLPCWKRNPSSLLRGSSLKGVREMPGGWTWGLHNRIQISSTSVSLPALELHHQNGYR